MEAKPDKRGFQRVARALLRLAEDDRLEALAGSSIELSGKPDTDAAAIEGLIRATQGASAVEATRREAALVLEAMAQVTDLSSIAVFDGTLKAKLDFLASKWFTPVSATGAPITLSSLELAAETGSPYREYVRGPLINPEILVDVISTLRQVGQQVVGIYDSADVSRAWIYYKT